MQTSENQQGLPSDNATLNVCVVGDKALPVDEQMVRSRLGPYAGLFYALRAKHPPSAAHGLRVGIGCSKWAAWRNMPDKDRDLLEIAALLHDVGKIGVPDKVLQKPSRLNRNEQMVMDMTSRIGVEMLGAAGAQAELSLIVEQSRLSFQESMHQTTVLARMLSIVDAFDSMNTEHAFRKSLGRDRAVEELCKNAGTQFDPILVREFAEMISQPRPELETHLAERWLLALCPENTPFFNDQVGLAPNGAVQNLIDSLFHHRLLEAMPDAAIYLDSSGQILHWNRAAEQLSGRSAASLLHCTWSPELLGLKDEQGAGLTKQTCPLQRSLVTNTQASGRLQAHRSDGTVLQVNMTAIPLFSSQRAFSGFVVLVRDASLQSDLEQRVQTLHAIATQDPLTKVANRAELTRRLAEFVAEHLNTNRAAAVIMCDIDYFKRINDTYGHQAGDDALVTFASILQDKSRNSDFVARYGGEEFVILCEGCDNNAAVARAESIRRSVQQTPIPSLKGNTMTASFGVTELQAGDSEETLLARVDRALMSAKETGRNRVVQLGAGQEPNLVRKPNSDSQEQATRANWMSWFTGTQQAALRKEYLAAVPREVAVQKLEGFVADHKAEILSANEKRVSVRIDAATTANRRKGEHLATMIMNIDVQLVQIVCNGRSKTYQNRTRFVVSIHPVKPRDRRAMAVKGQAHQILMSFQAYMVAQEIDEELRRTIIEPR